MQFWKSIFTISIFDGVRKEAALFTLLLLAVLVIALFGLFIAYSRKIRSINILRQPEEKSKLGFLDIIIDKIAPFRKEEEKLNKVLQNLDSKFSSRAITKIRILGIAISAGISIYFKNLLFFIPLSLVLSDIPIIVTKAMLKSRQSSYSKQFENSMRSIIGEYTITKNKRAAILNTSKKVLKPLRHEYERLYNSLSSGNKSEDCYNAFADRINTKWARLFAQMMVMHENHGGNLVHNIQFIINGIMSESISQEKNRTELSLVMYVNIILNAGFIILLVYNKVMYPENMEVLFDTPNGKFMLTLAMFLSYASIKGSSKIAEA